MYSDLTLMAWLQHLSMRGGEGVVPVHLSPGEEARVGAHEFGTARGVTIEVRRHRAGYCVRASNQFEDVTGWHCHTLGDPPERVTLSDIDR